MSQVWKVDADNTPGDGKNRVGQSDFHKILTFPLMSVFLVLVHVISSFRYNLRHKGTKAASY